MKAKLRISAVLVTLALIGEASADIIYSNLQNTAIPTGWTGVTLSVNGGSFNPFFGGVGVANDSLFQPARDGTGQLDTILNLSVGTTIGSSNGALNFSAGVGGSEDHLGSTYTAGTEGYIGFNANGDYGWMRVVFTNNTGGALIKDWAYDNSGSSGAIVVGRVQESMVDSSHNLVTLSPGSSETFTLGSVLADKGSGVTNSVVKTGAGTVTLTGSNTYSGSTTITSGTLAIGASTALGSSQVIDVQSGATLDVSAIAGGWTVGGTGASLSGNGTVVGNITISSGAILAPGSSVGTQTYTQDLTLNGSIFNWEIDSTQVQIRGTGYDAVDVGTTLGGTAAIFRIITGDSTYNQPFWSVQHSWNDIFNYASITTSLESIFSGGFNYSASPTGQGTFSCQTNTLL
ncbi:MAG: autotransporter-associated beta strand repeat-containing protein, partial [Verrucomicrobiota bacterium]